MLGPAAIEPLSNGYRPFAMLDFRVLGPLEAAGERGPLRLGGPKQRATLAILLLNANRVVSVERLADDLYAGDVPVTAVAQVQRQISELRKALGPDAPIETRPPGYVIRVSEDELDLTRFERGSEAALAALSRGDVERAAQLLREALALWRGPPLADLGYESFAQAPIDRLEELRLHALEHRIEAELALGRHRELVAELEQLVIEQPLRERFHAQLMLALYRSDRQAEALAAYRRARVVFVEQLGIEPMPSLRDLERAILAQDPALGSRTEAGGGRPAREPERKILVVPSDERSLDELLALAASLARLPSSELIVTRLVEDATEVAASAAALNGTTSRLGVNARAAAFTSGDRAEDVVRLARGHDVELVLVAAPAGVDAEAVPPDLAGILSASPADVAVLAGGRPPAEGQGLFVPFAGGVHDWAALELAAWLALATDAPLRLVGTLAAAPGRRDASRLLADASLAVQRVVGVAAEPVLAEPSERELVAAVASASLVVVGISESWRRQGIGESRRALVREAGPPTLLVHDGPRPGGLAPPEGRTRFGWTVEAPYLQAVSSAPTKLA
jgi:DNA-binding SARP family transcriptional activator